MKYFTHYADWDQDDFELMEFDAEKEVCAYIEKKLASGGGYTQLYSNTR